MRMSENSTRAPTERWAAHWYAVARASTLGAKQPLGVERLGQRLVLWRDTSGAVRCADAACPHRGADLGLGRVLQGQLECPYHGFRYDAAGACTLTPCEGAETKPSRALCLRLHPVREAHGLLWVYLGAPSSKPLPELPWIPGACEPDRHGATTEAVWNARFSRVMEGMMDLHHFPFAHRRYAPPGYTRLDPYEVHVEDGLIRTQGWLRKQAAAPGTGLRFEIHIRYPGVLLLCFSPRLQGVVVCTPVDAEHTWVCARFQQGYVRLPGLGWLGSWLALAFEFRFIQPDDYRLVRGSLPRSGSLNHGTLVRADRGIAAWHRLHEEALGGQRDAAASS